MVKLDAMCLNDTPTGLSKMKNALSAWLMVMLMMVPFVGFSQAGLSSINNVGIIGGNGTFVSALNTSLSNEGYTVNTHSIVPIPTVLAGYDAIFLIRTDGNNSLATWVDNGGLLITEWSAADWACNTANIIDATDSYDGLYFTGTPVTFTNTEIGVQLGAGMVNPYVDGVATEFFRNFSSIGSSVEVHATRNVDTEVIIGDEYGDGYVMVVGSCYQDKNNNLSGSQTEIFLKNILSLDFIGSNCADELACNYNPNAEVIDFVENFDGAFAPKLYSSQNAPVSDYIDNGHVSMTNGTWEVLDIETFECAALTVPNSLTWNTSVTSSNATLTFNVLVSNVSFNIGGPGTFAYTVNFDGGSFSYPAVSGNNDIGALITIVQSNISSIDFTVTTNGCLDNLAYSTGNSECAYDCCTPELEVLCSNDTVIECGTSIDPVDLGFPSYEGTDCMSGMANMTFADATSGSCPTVISRTWSVTLGDLTETCVQTITVEDTMAPEFTYVPSAITVECGDEYSEMATASDACGMEQVTVAIENYTALDCPMIEEYDRVFTAIDFCGNTNTATQHVIVIDTQGPVFDDAYADLTVACVSEVPAPGECLAEDACSGAADVSSWDVNDGCIERECIASDAFGAGDDWSVWLPVLANATNGNFVWNADGGAFDQFCDGTARLYGTVVNEDNASESFIVDLWFYHKADWTEWSDAGRWYKDDLMQVTNEHEAWTYYEMVDGYSSLTGADDFAGDVLYLSHMPASKFFGFQIGDKANNKNDGYGMSGWFTYNGFVNNTAVSGHGDVNVDLECETPGLEEPCEENCDNSFTYLWRAVDECGWATIQTQTIYVKDTIAPVFTDLPYDLTVSCETVPVDTFPMAATDNCECDVTILFSEDIIEGDCPNNYTIARTWGAIDACGNLTQHTQNINVIDEQAPVFAGLPSEMETVECDAIPAVAVVTANDNCSDSITVMYSEDMMEGNCPGDYTIYRYWYAMDECGNSNEFQQVLNVVDTQAPEFVDFVPYGYVNCDEVPGVDVQVVDNCDENPVITYSDILNSGGCIGVIMRTYSVEDNCGNTNQAVRYYTLIDSIAPVFTNFPADATVECDNIPAVAEGLMGEDNCTEDVYVAYVGQEIVEGNCIGNYTIIRTWSITDNCENTMTQSQTINVIDQTAPMFEYVPHSATYECDEQIAMEMATAYDNCGTADVTVSNDTIAGNCDANYSIVRTFTATDDCGNAATASQTIIVEDTTAPTFTVPSDVTVACDADNSPLTTGEPSNIADNCSATQYDFSDYIVAGNCIGNYTIERTWAVVDACGNDATQTQYINVVDEQAPVFGAYEMAIDVPCDHLEDDIIIPSATDNCGSVIVTFSDVFVSGNCAGRCIRTYVATDDCGNAASIEQIITLIDEVAPVLEGIPSNTSVECSDYMYYQEDMEYSVWATDNCDENVEISMTSQTIDGPCEDSYTVVNTWIATDHCNNADTATQTINVSDNTNPTFDYQLEDLSIECSDELPAVEYPMAYDNCDMDVEVSVTHDTLPANGDCANEFVIQRIFRATDNCGNFAMQIVDIYVSDNTAPEFTSVPNSLSLECGDATPVTNAEAEDNCSDVMVSQSDATITGDCVGQYTIVRTFTATDACGNATSVDSYIYFDDNTAPVFDAYDVEVNIECGTYPNNIPVPSASDLCSSVMVTFSDIFVSGNCAGRYIRTLTAIDDCGNMAYGEQIITLIDEVAPVLEGIPSNTTVDCDEYMYYAYDMDYSVWATDNCDQDVDVAMSTDTIDGNCAGNYDVVHTWIATDHCGNADTASQTINVVDTEAPYWEYVPYNMTVSCDQDLELDMPYAYDECSGIASLTESMDTVAGNCIGNYTIIRTFVATDNCGNSSEESQMIYVNDYTAPTFEYVPSSVTVECSDVIPSDMATAYDNCGTADVTVSSDTVAGQCMGNYTITRTFTATDDCGNSSEESQVIYVIDITAPEFDAYEVEVDIDCGTYPNNIPVPTATDLCGSVMVTFSDVFVSGSCAGRYIRTLTATDDCGNMAYGEQIITLVDETAPVLNGIPSDATVDCDEYMYYEYDMEYSVWATDNCDQNVEISMSSQTINGNCAGNYTIVHTWIATDHCENADTATQTINVVDTEAPYWEYVPNNMSYDCQDEFELEDAYAYDNCSGATVSVSNDTIAGNCVASYSIVRTFNAVDACGNAAQTMTQTIEVSDNTAPVWEVMPNSTSYSCDENIVYENATAYDNCSQITVSVDENIIPGSCPSEYTIERTFSAVDSCGNAAQSFTQSIYVYDNAAPVWDAYPQDITVECSDDLPAAAPCSATDNCSDITYGYDEYEVPGDINACGFPTIVRVWTAVDACGNAAEDLHQYVYTVDTQAPEFVDCPGNISLVCGSEIPAAIAPAVMDNCDNDVQVYYAESIEGDAPVAGSIADCDLTTPQVPGWGLIMFGFNGDTEEYYTDGEAQFVEFPNGTAHLTGAVTNGSEGWIMDVWFNNPLDWSDWSSLGRSYKDDNLHATNGGDLWEDWTYYLLNSDSASLTGTGNFTGSTLALSHAPSSLYYGFQVGEAANNFSAAYGMGGWFYYEGTVVEQGDMVYEVSGAGDFAFEGDCCNEITVTRTWTAMDCSGNVTECVQVIDINEVVEEDIIEEQDDVQVLDIAKNQINLYPNPTNGKTTVEFAVVEAGNVTINVTDITGKQVKAVFKDKVNAQQLYRTSFDVTDMPNGMYIYKVVTNGKIEHKKFMVAK